MTSTSAAAATAAPVRGVDHVLHEFEGGPYIRAMQSAPYVPVLVAIAYLAFVHLAPKHLTASRGVVVPKLHLVVAAWNLFFALFSMVGFYYTFPVLRTLVLSEYLPDLAPKYDPVTQTYEEHPRVPGGLYSSLCYWNANIFQHGVAAFWLLAFDLSKIPEMMDTVFLVLQKKRVVFLHWYHHVTVMLFCWHAHVTYISNGLWFAVMNMGVHSIMYLYYFMCALGYRKVVRPFAPLITFLQILQMFAGLTLVLYTGYLHIAHPQRCDTNLQSIGFGMLMYATYIFLFVQFFYEHYVVASKRSAVKFQKAVDDAVPSAVALCDSPISKSDGSHGIIGERSGLHIHYQQDVFRANEEY